MLRFFRVRAWCLAIAAFLALGTAGTSLEVLLHGEAAHHTDPCAAPVIVGHDVSAHQITATPDSAADESAAHCVACHLARTLRLRAESASLISRGDDGRTFRVPTCIGAARAAALEHLQPRSPPRVAYA
jgi:hypothetical protein